MTPLVRPEEVPRPSIWHALGTSVQGASHRRTGRPNQDALGISSLAQGVAVVLSDGHGDPASFRSDRGAAFAVEEALKALAEVADRGKDLSFSQLKRAVEEGFARDLVWRWRHRVAADREADPWEELPSPAAPDARNHGDTPYGATVLGALGTAEYLLLFQLGDGDMLAVRNDAVFLPLPPDPRCFANVTTSLCLPDAALDVRTMLLPRHEEWPTLLLLATDGYSNSFAGREDFLRTGRDFSALLKEHPGEAGRAAVAQELPSWLHEASAQGSGDDITVALLIRDF